MAGRQSSWTGGRLNNLGNRGFYIRLDVEGRNEQDLGAAFKGRLDELVAERAHMLAKAFVDAAHVVADKGKKKLRADIVAGGFHNGVALSKTWRGKAFPAKGRASFDPAVSLQTKSSLLIDVFETGVTITAHGAKYLAVPIGPAKAIVRRFNKAVRFSRRDSGFGRNFRGQYSDLGPSAVDRVKAALGVDLVPIISPDGKAGVLVAVGRKLTPTGRSAKRQTGQSTPLFALVRQASLRKRIRGRAVLAEIAASFWPDFTAALAAALPEEVR